MGSPSYSDAKCQGQGADRHYRAHGGVPLGRPSNSPSLCPSLPPVGAPELFPASERGNPHHTQCRGHAHVRTSSSVQTIPGAVRESPRLMHNREPYPTFCTHTLYVPAGSTPPRSYDGGLKRCRLGGLTTARAILRVPVAVLVGVNHLPVRVYPAPSSPCATDRPQSSQVAGFHGKGKVLSRISAARECHAIPECPRWDGCRWRLAPTNAPRSGAPEPEGRSVLPASYSTLRPTGCRSSVRPLPVLASCRTLCIPRSRSLPMPPRPVDGRHVHRQRAVSIPGGCAGRLSNAGPGARAWCSGPGAPCLSEDPLPMEMGTLCSTSYSPVY